MTINVGKGSNQCLKPGNHIGSISQSFLFLCLGGVCSLALRIIGTVYEIEFAKYSMVTSQKLLFGIWDFVWDFICALSTNRAPHG